MVKNGTQCSAKQITLSQSISRHGGGRQNVACELMVEEVSLFVGLQ